MTMTMTLSLLGAAIVVAVLANVLSRRPTEFGKVRLFPYLGLQFIALVCAMFMAAHLLTLISGK